MFASLSSSDIISIINLIVLIATAIVLIKTVYVIKTGNEDNARLNRLQAIENTIIKQLEFHYNILGAIKVDNVLINRTPVNYGSEIVYGQEAFKIFYEILKLNYREIKGKDEIEDIIAEKKL